MLTLGLSADVGRCVWREVEDELSCKARRFDRAMQQRHERDGGLVIGAVPIPYQPGAEGNDEHRAYMTGAYLPA
jgi:hypothetical protein